MTESNIPTSVPPQDATEVRNDSSSKSERAARRRLPFFVVLSTLLALAAWAALIWLDGYVAMGVAAASIALGIVGVVRQRGAWRNLAVTAIICSGVLVVVLLAFLIVIKIGLS